MRHFKVSLVTFLQPLPLRLGIDNEVQQLPLHPYRLRQFLVPIPFRFRPEPIVHNDVMSAPKSFLNDRQPLLSAAREN